MRLDRFINNDRTNRHFSYAEEVFLKRWRDKRRTGAIDVGGPNIQITDCDIYSSLQVLISTDRRATSPATSSPPFRATGVSSAGARVK